MKGKNDLALAIILIISAVFIISGLIVIIISYFAQNINNVNFGIILFLSGVIPFISIIIGMVLGLKQRGDKK